MNDEMLKTYGLARKWFASFAFILLLCALVLGCNSTKNLNMETTTLGTEKKSDGSSGSDGTTAGTSLEDFGFDDHFGIWVKPGAFTSTISDSSDSLTQSSKGHGASEILLLDSLENEFGTPNGSEIKSAVADKIVQNYVTSKNKSPGGHCLTVSKKRFEKAYEDVHGHSVYEDLPASMATEYYTSREVYDYLYVSASGIHNGWRSLPEKYRGKGNAGAIAYAGMGTLVDGSGIWSGELRPGAPMQVWRHRNDYEKVVRGVNHKNFDPFGHSFIFIGYVRDEKNEITGIRIADQGYQGYRPLLPNDYEVWWAVNLSI